MNGKNGMGTGALAGLGDIAPVSVDPMERYFRIIRGQVSLPRRGWIVQPEWKPTPIPGLEAIQALLENHSIPRNWQLLEDFFVLLQRGRLMVKGPNWIEPPVTAEIQDIASEDQVAVGATNTTIITYTVPDRCVASFQAFGHLLSLSSQWGTVIWNILVNERAIRTYQEFKQQRGDFVQPTKLPSPILLKGRDVLKVTARTSGNAVNAIARIQGYVIPAETVTQDGSYKDWNSR